MVVTDRSTLEAAGITFAHVMDTIIATSDAPATDRLELYQQWWSQVDRVESDLGQTDPFDLWGGTDITENPDSYVPVAVLNRFDLAPANYSTCGQVRIVFGKRSVFRLGDLHDRNLLIFEAEVPNPNPSAGAAGCRPLTDLWNELPCESSWDRSWTLRKMFFDGVAGVPPVVQADHFGPGAGQIRSETFRDQGEGVENTWMFREFEVETAADGLEIVQVPVGARRN